METDLEFDAKLDAYQARLADEALEAEERSWTLAQRPSAARSSVPAASLLAGDYITAEPPGGRWVRVVEVRGPHSYVKRREAAIPDGQVSILFELVESVVVSGETRYWIDRDEDALIVVDADARGDGYQPYGRREHGD